MKKKIKEYYKRINNDFRVRSILWNDFMFAVLIFIFQLSGWNDYLFSKALIPTLIVLFFLLMFFLIFLKPRKSFLSKAVNQIDYSLFFLEIILLILPLAFSPFYPSLNYEKSFYFSTLEKLGWQNGPLALKSHSPNFIIFCSSFVLFVVLVFITLFRIKKTSQDFLSSSIEAKRPSITIKEANDIKNLPEKLEDLFISDSPLSEDYLNETEKISEFYSEIKQYVFNNMSDPVNFGITGHYGSGKTTFYNNIKAKAKGDDANKQIIWIDDFNVWQYKDEQALLSGMIDRILKEVLLTSSNPKIIKQKAERISNSYFSKKTGNIADLFDFGEDYSKLITQANDILTSDNKTVVFQIDNIDRGTQSMVTFVYKAIASILKFQKIIYVCLYDETLVKKAFESENLPENFLDKVISYKINLDTIEDKDLQKLEKKVLGNIFQKYQCSNSKTQDAFYSCLPYLHTIRDFIIFVNNTKFVLQPDFFLNPRDYLYLSIIRLKCIELYKIIFNNENSFVSIGQHGDDKTSIFNSTFVPKESRKQLFNSILNNPSYSLFRYLLAYLFSPFKDHLNNSPVILNEPKDPCNTDNCYIEEADYFAAYFDLTESTFSQVNESLKKTIAAIQKSPQSLEDNNKRLTDFFLDNKTTTNEKILFACFDKHVSEISTDAVSIYISFLFDNFNNFADPNLSESQSNRSRLLAKLLIKLSLNDFKETIAKYSTQYKLLSAFRSLSYYLDLVHHPNRKDYTSFFEEEIKKMSKTIIEQRIDIFSKDNYCSGGIYCLQKYTEAPLLLSYLKAILNKDNVYLILKDCLVSSYNGITYQYSLGESFALPAQTKDIIGSLLTKEELTEDEKKLKEMFTVFKTKGDSDSLPTYTSRQAFDDLSVLK